MGVKEAKKQENLNEELNLEDSESDGEELFEGLESISD